MRRGGKEISEQGDRDGLAVVFGRVLCGVGIFFLFQYGVALWRLGNRSSGMMNKFSALARDKYLDFLIWENVYVLIAYLILIFVFSLILHPCIWKLSKGFSTHRKSLQVLMGVAGAIIIHAYCTLRLVQTRPYFLDDAEFGHWYYQVLNVVPESIKSSVNYVLFIIVPAVLILYAMVWWLMRMKSLKMRVAMVFVGCCLVGVAVFTNGWLESGQSEHARKVITERPNVIIIGSDSLRGDRLGCTGYEPVSKDGLAAGGVSPRIDALARESVNFTNCFTPIASTLESGTSLMGSQYPHTHGFRHMYPNEKTLNAATAGMQPMAAILKKEGYDTAAFGDWCAGYYELMPMGFGHVAVSSFDNFKMYMSQAVVMAHFVIPLYFDHPAGYSIFPQLGSFAQFVTPDVVTDRVEKRLKWVVQQNKPFFWHIFYSCNHLPYRNPEPYSSMFTDPDYAGANKNGVDFDIDSFIGKTNLESKWKALPKKEIRQIRNLYDGCTRHFDDHVGRILDALKSRGIENNTIILITSDHGDNLYEKDVTLGHGLTFNGGLQANHVPMIVRVPGTKAAKISEHVRTIDIIPTLADLLEVEKPALWEGQSVASWIKGTGEPKSKAFYAETGFPFIQFRVKGADRPQLPPMDQMTRIEDSFNYQFVLKSEFEEPLIRAKQRCLMTEKWKLICTPTADGGRHFGLFGLTNDIYNDVDVSNQEKEVLRVMKSALERWMDEHVETQLEEIFPEGEG
ncbi:MAG: sulfatase [Armatimonadetes bacterium]|nr:sulfatase [Akkermansiaceae bacterium]